MAEAAIGGLSLAIQIIQGLVTYIDGVRGAKGKAIKILDETERLAQVLECLDTVVKSSRQNGPQGIATEGIIACASALEAIKKKLGPGNDTGGSGFRQQLRSLGQKLSFPFKQGEIMFLRDMLGSMERQLQLALSAVQIENDAQMKLQTAQLIQLSQANLQSGHEQRAMLQIGFSQQSAHQETLAQSLHHAFNRRIDPVQAGISGLDNNMQLIAADVSRISSSLPEILSKLTQLEEKNQHVTLAEVSPRVLKQDISEFATLGNDITRLQHTKIRKRTQRQTCTCRSRTNKTVLVEWPFQLVKTQTTDHRSDCPYATFEEVVTDLQLRFTMCSISLRRKAHIGLALYHGAGSSSISPVLECDRIVLKSSPAFRLMANFEKRLGTEPGVEPWEKPINELLWLFQLRKATPYDRLPNGMTLLHYFCNRMSFNHDEAYSANCYAIGKRILEILPTQALEKDEFGRTCVDHVLGSQHIELANHFVENGIPISLTYVNFFPGYKNSLDYVLQNAMFNPDILDGSELYKAIMMRSEETLVDLLHKKNLPPDYHEDGWSLYELAVGVRWRRGCEILFESGIRVTNRGPGKLLTRVIGFGDQDVVNFWMDVRRHFDSEELTQVGAVEDALASYEVFHSSSDWPAVCVPVLAQERQQLRTLAAMQGIECSTDRLPDAQAWSLIQELETRGVEVKPFLKPKYRSVYHVPDAWWQVRTLDVLYEAGFCDVTADAYAHEAHWSVSPLLYQITCFQTWSIDTLLEVIDWFCSKDASLSETWPGSDLSVIQCAGFRLGNKAEPHAFEPYGLNSHFTNQDIDSCTCACSKSGCLFITSFYKGLMPHYYHYLWRDRVQIMAAFVEDATHKNRWLVTEAIRLIVFTALGIRHTCCDIIPILHDGEPNYDARPVRSMDSEELDRILEEDAELVQLLEELVEQFDERYDGSCFKDFIKDTLIPEMDTLLADREKEDREQYAQGRREIGVIMEIENDDDERSEYVLSDYESFDERELEL